MLTGDNLVPDDLADYTTGFVQGEVEAMAAERESLGYTQVGAAVITSIEVRKARLDATTPRITLDVCIDSSGIDVLDSTGASLKASLYDPGHPVLNRYGAEYRDGAWKISTHEIPENGHCS